MFVVIACVPVCDVINFEKLPYFSYQVVFLKNQKNQDENLSTVNPRIYAQGLYNSKGLFAGLICGGGRRGGAYTRGNNKITNFNLAISTFLVI